MRLLEGVVDEQSDTTVDDLQAEISDLRRQLSQARAETKTAQREAAHALSALRKQLNPLYRALQAVFGELDAAGIESDDTLQPPNARTAQMWAVWKDKLGKGPAKAIDALLLHGAMTRKQIAVATGYSPQNISNIISDLNNASLITKDGDRVTLRTL